MERKIKHTINNVKPYNALTNDEQKHYNFMFGKLTDYLYDHPNVELSWDKVNVMLPHVYKWSIDLYNKKYAVNGALDYSDNGIIFLANIY